MAANPRAAAVAALVRQEQDGFSNLILDAELKRQKLEGRDKAFASAIFYTVCPGARDPACCAGTGPLYAGAGVSCRQ